MNWVRDILADTLPERTVESVRSAARGNHKETAIVTLDDGTSVVVQRSARPDALATEVALTRAIADRTDVPVPTVLTSSETEGYGYAVLERAPGVDLHERFSALDPDARETVARTFGRTLATLQDTFAFDAYGPVVAENESLGATGPTDWATYFGTYAREGIDALPEAFTDLRADLRKVVDSATLPADPPAELYPWDLRPGNALVADSAVTAVLDWGQPLSAAPGLALAKTEHLVADWYVPDSGLRDAFRAGYREIRPLPAVPRVYRLVAVVRSAVDSQGEVTRPRYPELTGEDAVAFHRERLGALL